MTDKNAVRSAGKRKRKVVDGPLRNKERTKEKLVRAVGKILAKEGHTGLTTVNIGRAAKVDRKLIYKYFGSFENLIETYFKENDFWEPGYNKFIAELLLKKKPLTLQDMMTILEGQFENMLSNQVFQKTILWEISQKSRLMRKMSDEREQVGKQLFHLTEESFKGSGMDLQAILALQIAGIYYLTLHAKMNGSTFCGIDISLPEGEERIREALEEILKHTCKKAES